MLIFMNSSISRLIDTVLLNGDDPLHGADGNLNGNHDDDDDGLLALLDDPVEDRHDDGVRQDVKMKSKTAMTRNQAKDNQ